MKASCHTLLLPSPLRFIPSRSGDLSSTYALLNEYASPKLKRKANAEPDVSKEQGDRTYQQVLRNELFPNMASSFEEDSRAAQVSRNLVPSTPTKVFEKTEGVGGEDKDVTFFNTSS